MFGFVFQSVHGCLTFIVFYSRTFVFTFEKIIKSLFKKWDHRISNVPCLFSLQIFYRTSVPFVNLSFQKLSGTIIFFSTGTKGHLEDSFLNNRFELFLRCRFCLTVHNVYHTTFEMSIPFFLHITSSFLKTFSSAIFCFTVKAPFCST